MKKRSLALVMLSFILMGCVSTGNGGGTSSFTTPNKVDDSELAKYDELPELYDNKVVLEPVNGSTEAPDPFVYRFNGWYYLYPTTGGGYQKAYKSQDLIYWEKVDNGVNQPGFVYEYGKDSGRPAAQTPFAPEIIYYNGKFYMISSPNGQGHYIFESDSPEGPFTAITGNVGRNIDGHFFIDSDENLYMYGASSGAIVVYGMENDFRTFQQNDEGGDRSVMLSNCKVGGWNEGPYMLQRNGDYFLTYCGSHYLSSSYRVDYAYAEAGANLFSSSDYVREDTVVVKSDPTFKGLGHSSTVLAPDMDSYYIVYHDINDNRTRNLDMSRLSFNGSVMVANGVRESGIVGVNGPEFAVYDDSEIDREGDYLLSSDATEDCFTVEYNVAGEGKMIFSFVDNQNYSYILFKDNKLTVNSVENGTEKLVADAKLNYEYDPTVYHTFRLQYRDGEMNLYFDSMEKLYGVKCNFVPGKMGYEANHNFDEVGYTAYSNVGLGSSDNKYYADTISLANGYDEKLSYFAAGPSFVDSKAGNATQVGNYNLVLKNQDDRATYRMYAPEEGEYLVNIRIPASSLGKEFGLRVDNGQIIKNRLSSENLKYEKGDVLLTLGKVELTQGQHNISIYNVGEEVSFSQVQYEHYESSDDTTIIFDKTTDLTFFDTYEVDRYALTDEGLYADEINLQAICSQFEFDDVTIETEVKVDQVTTNGVFGMMFNVEDFSKNCREDADNIGNSRMFRGMRLVFEDGNVVLENVDFNFSKQLKSKKFKLEDGQTYTLTAVVKGNHVECYVDGELLFEVSNNIGNLNGKVGLLSSRAVTHFKSLSITAN